MSATASASPLRSTVGDRVTVAIGLDAPSRSTVTLRNPPSMPAFTRISVSPWTFHRGTAGWKVERTETWVPFATGSLSPLRYAYTIRATPGAQETGSMATAPLTVPSVLPAGTAPPAPFRPPVTKTFVSWQIVAAFVLAASIALLFALLLRRRRITSAVRTADEIFDDELDLLESSLAKSVPEETFYDWLAEITRWYLEQKLAVPASRMTSTEILVRTRAAGSEEAADDLQVVFSVCDGYRFAQLEHRRDHALSGIVSAREAAASIRERETADAALETA